MQLGIAPKAARADIVRLRTCVRALLELDDDTCVLVQQLVCGEPGCPPVETVVAVLDPAGGRRTWKLHRSAAEIGTGDLRAALLGGSADEHEHEHEHEDEHEDEHPDARERREQEREDDV